MLRFRSPIGSRPLSIWLASLSWTLAAFAAFALTVSTTALGQTITWDAGSGTNFNWDTIQNWSGDTSKPVAVNDVLFPAPIPNPGSLASPGTIILTAGEVANSLTFNAAFTLRGGTLALSTAGANAGNVTVPFGQVRIESALTGAGGFTKLGNGRVILVNAQTYSGTTNVNGGSLFVEGSIAGSTVTVNTNAILGGSGTIFSPVTISGVLAPGSQDTPITIQNGPGQLDTANLSLQSGSSFIMEIYGPNPATEYDQINVTGTVTLTGGQMSFGNYYGSRAPNFGDQFFAILNDGSDPIMGTFAGLPEGARVGAPPFALGGVPLFISYIGNGDGGPIGNDVVLIAIPEPGCFASFFGGIGMILGLHRIGRKA